MEVIMMDLASLDRIRTNALVIRHADRDAMRQWQIEQPLNEIGMRNAVAFGQELRGFSNYAFFSSPVDRCRQTIECIQTGVFAGQRTAECGLSEILGKPGPFVVDRMNNEFKINPSCREVVIAQIAHCKLLGIRRTEEGAKMFMDYVTEQMNSVPNGTLLIFVTHDAIIAPVIFELTGERFDYDNWPDFLDGFVVEKHGEDFKVMRNNKTYEI